MYIFSKQRIIHYKDYISSANLLLGHFSRDCPDFHRRIIKSSNLTRPVIRLRTDPDWKTSSHARPKHALQHATTARLENVVQSGHCIYIVLLRRIPSLHRYVNHNTYSMIISCCVIHVCSNQKSAKGAMAYPLELPYFKILKGGKFLKGVSVPLYVSDRTGNFQSHTTVE